ncbi:MAG: MCE family protein [Deltaproteobacteria bacterium]|nr:MCE family protein [Deltaproteobacteria bacterium]
MKIYLSYRERIAGFFIFITLLIVFLFVVGAAVENMWFTPKVSYYLYVDQGDGLSKTSPVLLSGVEVGKVGDMTIMGNGRIKVELQVLEKFAPKIKEGTTATVKRALVIGEKRVLLTLPLKIAIAKAKPVGGSIPVNNQKDILDVISQLDFGKYLETLDSAVKSLDVLMAKLDEDQRLSRMIEAFDDLGPTLKTMNRFLTDIDDPFVTLIQDPALLNAFKGGAKVFNDKKTREMIHDFADSIEPEKLNSMLVKSEQMIIKLDAMLEPDSHIQKTFKGTDKLLNDGKLDKMLTSMSNLTNEQQVAKLMSNLTILSTQMAKIGPQIPGMATELNNTMHELSIVLKALQKTWLLDDETEEVLKKMKKESRK